MSSTSTNQPINNQPINPENPYVFNPNYFSSVSHFDYEKSSLAIAQRLMCTLGPLLGLSTSCLIIYLVIWQTPKHLKMIGKMLLLCASSDIFYALCDLWCQERFKINSIAIFASLRGPASLFSYKVQCYSFTFKSGSQILEYLIIPLQYHFRLYSLRNNAPPGFLQITIYVSISFFITLAHIYTSAQAFCTYQNDTNIDYGQFWYKESVVPQLIVGIQANKSILVQVILFVFCCFGSYFMIIYLSRETVKELHKQSSYMSPKTIAIEKQIGRALFAQSMVPLLFAVLPLVIGQFTAQMNIDVGYFIDFHNSFTTLFPFFNSLSSLYFIIPYRNACQRLLFPCWFGKISNFVTSTSDRSVAVRRSGERSVAVIPI